MAAGAFLGGSCQEGPRKGALIAAASSLRELLTGSLQDFPGAAPEFSFDASSSLARQIRAGARFDAFLSADQHALKRVGEWGRAKPAPFLSNRLSLIARHGVVLDHEWKDPGELARYQGAIAIGAPEVPVGRYTRECLGETAFTSLEGRFVHVRNARGILGLVEGGSADFGFIYHSDLTRMQKSTKLWVSSKGAPPDIRYWAQLSRASLSNEAQAYFDWILSGGLRGLALELGFA